MISVLRRLTRANPLAKRVHDAARAVLSALARPFGLAVLETDAESLVPVLPPPSDPLWMRRSPMPGVELDLDAQMAFVERELAPHTAEFPVEVRAKGYELWNGLYNAGDSEMLYALVRHLKPRRIVEIGSGYSTRVTAAALRVNAAEGASTEFVAIDPDPRQPVESLPQLTRFERRDCRDVPLATYLSLEAGDILHIDTTHVVKLGGVVNWLVLELLPQIAPGVWVQIHDVHLPYEYPRKVLEIAGHMNEQYLVHAFLVGNAQWRVKLALSALAREHNDRFFAVLPTLREPLPGLPGWPTWLPAAFWIRRRT